MSENKPTLKRPPLVTTPLTPEEIVGYGNLDIFRKHLQICSSDSNGGEFPEKRLNKEIGLDNRRMIGETYDRLRDHGFSAGSVKQGKIIWKTALKSQSQEVMEKGLEGLRGRSRNELANIARAGYREITKRADMPETTPADLNFEQHNSTAYAR
ncbi:hypothetical protein [Desulfopila inferna]|uniref:hypothetical protein n=1 Tax=Desulfopila inferna TaxID=468528 RepID=UPI0019645CD6|nr:hypothetical protein [Desulfopila inferna]MBM9604107.1 hypothetical protein [Desulfopila inferna]